MYHICRVKLYFVRIFDFFVKEFCMVDIRFSSIAGRLRRTEIRELLKLTRLPDTISFGGGLPDPAIFPYDAVEAASIKAIR